MTEATPIEPPHLSLLEEFKGNMDKGQKEKLDQILPHISPETHRSGSVIISIGAGTGKLEKAISNIFPETTVVGVDYSLPMIEEIRNQNNKNESSTNFVEPLQARAENLPLESNSADIIIISSVVHEIISFSDNYKLDHQTKQFFQEIARVLKPKGRAIIRDFMQPTNPNQEVILKIGNTQEENDADPIEFIQKFIDQFKGDDLNYVKAQIENLPNGLKRESKLKLQFSHALEVLAHYSWAYRFEDEVKEKYAYLPIDQYAQNIVNCAKESGVDVSVLSTKSLLQPGYPEHINGRIDLFDSHENQIPLPSFTGVIVIEKSKN